MTPGAVDAVVTYAVVRCDLVCGGESFGSRSERLQGCSSVDRAVRAHGVVVVNEVIELLLELGDGGYSWLGAEVLFQGLVEALDFAAGLWVIGPAGDVSDAEFAEDDLQGGATPASGCGGEYGSVVGQYGCWCALVGEGGGEGVDDVRAGDGGSGGAGDGQAGVVIERVEDFDAGVIGEVPVGDVGLPEFVGLLSSEPFPGRAGAFVWLRGDEAAPGQHTRDRAQRRNFGDGGIAGEMFGDGGSTRVIALFGQDLAERVCWR